MLHIIGGNLLSILGLLLFAFVTYQHYSGVFIWHKNIKNPIHRKLGIYIVIFGRIVACLGWITSEENQLYSIAIFVISIGLYAFVERKNWKKIKII